MRNRVITLSVVLIIILLILSIASLFIGNYKIGFSELTEYIGNKINGNEYDRGIESVIVHIRLVRIVAAVLVGAALAVAGTVYQAVFSNNMVSPDLLGVSSSAAFGAALAIILGLSSHMNFVFSFLFSVVSIFLTVLFSKALHGKGNLLLSGIIVSGFARSGLGLMKYIADSETGELDSIVYWELGSIAKVTWKQLAFAAPAIAFVMIILFLIRRRTECLIFGETAELFGIHFSFESILSISLASLLVSISTSLCGVISWVGLVIPLAAFELTRSGSIVDNMPIAALIGSVFLLGIDDIARAATTSEIPISILTGAVGIVVFIIAVISRRKRSVA